MLFNFHIFVKFPVSYCYWFLVSCFCGKKRYLVWCQSFKVYKDLFCDITHTLSWQTCVCLRRICTLLLIEWNRMVYLLLLDPFGIKCSSCLMFSSWFSVCIIYPLWKVGYLSPLPLLYSSISPLRSVNFCLIYLGLQCWMHKHLQLLYSLDEVTHLSLYSDLLCPLLQFFD